MRKVLYVFGLLTDEDIGWMIRFGARRRLAAGEAVVTEGRPLEFVVILLRGELVITADGFGEIARLGAGEIVGEMSLVDSSLPSATVTAGGDCLALFLDKSLLMRKVESDVGFGYRFFRALAVFLADRLRATRKLPSWKERGLSDNAILLRDELDPGILDTTSLAGERFNRMLETLIGSEPGA